MYHAALEKRCTFFDKSIPTGLRASNKAKQMNTLFSLFHHKGEYETLTNGIVISEKTGEVTSFVKTVNTMHKCVDLKPMPAATKLGKLIKEFSLEKNSFKKFNRSADLHSLALHSDSIENQMINLWIAIESIIPAKPEERDVSSIEHIIDSLSPFLNIGYLERLISKFTRDALNWNAGVVKNSLKNVNGSGLPIKMAALMSLQKYSDEAQALRQEFRDFHLMPDRFDYFSQILSSPRNVFYTLLTHNKRVGWQIRRIYRARNLIVHSGTTPSYTEILIENTHDYLDLVMGRIMRLATHPKQIRTIEQAFTLTELSYKSMLKWLDSKDSQFNETTITKIFDVDC